MNILKACDLFTGANAAFDDRSFFLTVIRYLIFLFSK